jgi:hypothetical protein
LRAILGGGKRSLTRLGVKSTVEPKLPFGGWGIIAVNS